MLGNPKFDYGDKVKFEIDGKTKVGTIEIIDAYGTFFYNEDVSYDIMVKETDQFVEENILYKHIHEKFVEKA